MLQIGEKYVRFAGEDSVCSNLVPCNLRIPCHSALNGRIEFESVEHGYVWTRLQWLGLHQDAAHVMQISGPKDMMLEAKRILRNRRRSNQTIDRLCIMWQDVYAEQLIQDLVFAKADQNPSLKRMLLDNSSKIFLESTPDTHWGIGLPTNEARNLTESQLSSRIRGQNRFGKILKLVAETLADPMSRNVKPANVQLQFFLDQANVHPAQRLQLFQRHNIPWNSYRTQITGATDGFHPVQCRCPLHR